MARTLNSDHWMAWVNMPLGSVMWHNVGIVDVLAIFRSYTNRAVRIYEVKVSRGDFLADVNMGKYLKYLEHCTQFYFATPAGLISKDEVPAGCGLMVKGDTTWKTVKAAPRRDYEFTPDLLLALLMKGYQDHCEIYRNLAQKEQFLNFVNLRKAAADFGIRVSEEIASSKELLDKAEEIKEQLSKALGRDFRSVFHAVSWLQSDIDRLLNKHQYIEEAVELAQVTMRLFQGTSYGTPRALREIADKLDKNPET